MTYQGKITQLYTNMVNNSIDRGHAPPGFSKEEFDLYCKGSAEFNTIWAEWESGGFQPRQGPSFGRMDETKGYSWDNAELKTFHRNLLSSDGLTDDQLRRVAVACKAFGASKEATLRELRSLGFPTSSTRMRRAWST